ncbi:MAG: Rieske 2Fe-2S domain-containing protein [Aquificae bacterium]|nr:Rieske 2Fe-2S domain-containing protein [Aquificota bacterium]
MERRDFVKLCLSLPSLLLLTREISFSTEGLEFRKYRKALLKKKNGEPLKPEDLEVGKQYIFFYPYRSTPAFLLNLGKEIKPLEISLPDGEKYLWPGGVGPDKSIVAFCAICPHQLSFPTPEYSFINYYPKGRASETVKKDGVILCCAHISVFDPEKGGKVLEGPSEYPLLSIVLSYEDGKLYAVGTLGKDLYRDFFDAYRRELRKMYRSFRKAKKKVSECVVLEVEEYVKDIIRC